MGASSRQRGFLLIAAAVLIAVAAVMAAIIITLTAGSGRAGTLHVASTQALFAAESGLERALYGFSRQGTSCAGLNYSGTVPIGAVSASFATSATAYSAASLSLASNISASATIIPVTPAAALANYAPHGRLFIEGEAINYSGSSTDPAVCGAGNPACFTGITRGVAGSVASAHTAGTRVRQGQCLIRSVGTSGGAQRTLERAISLVGGRAGAMVVYTKDQPANQREIPFYRIWNGTSWGAEQQATNLGTGNSRTYYFVLKFARTRNEAVLGTLSENGEIRVQVWNGTSWGTVTLLANVGVNAAYRGFDIEYEPTSDRAIVVYNNANNPNPAYRLWDGTSWSAARSLDQDLGADYPTSDAPRWIELAPHPVRNEIVMITLDQNNAVVGVRWNGVSWATLPGGAAVWENNAATSRAKVIDVAYEQQSGRAMFLWGRSGPCNLFYRIWDGTSLSGTASLPVGPDCNEARWIRLVADPSSNALMSGSQDQNRILNTWFWSGTAWSAPVRHPDTTEDVSDRNYDIAFEASGGRAWLMWGRWLPGPDRTTRRQWLPGSGWGAVTSFGQDAALVQLATHTGTGYLFAAIYQDSSSPTDDIVAHQWDGTNWSAQTQLWGGPTVNNPVMERVQLAPMGFRLREAYDWLEVYP